jgi:hypothetical protein
VKVVKVKTEKIIEGEVVSEGEDDTTRPREPEEEAKKRRELEEARKLDDPYSDPDRGSSGERLIAQPRRHYALAAEVSRSSGPGPSRISSPRSRYCCGPPMFARYLPAYVRKAGDDPALRSR